MKRWLIPVIGAALLLGGCDRGGSQSNSLTAEVEYPVAHFDLQVQVAMDQPDAAVRQLTARIADTDGVAVAEADYDAHLVRVALRPDAIGEAVVRTRGAISALPGIRGVEPAP